MHPFQNYYYLENSTYFPEIKALFYSKEFLEANEHICGADSPYIKPFQAGYILQTPGQSVPVVCVLLYFNQCTVWLYYCMLWLTKRFFFVKKKTLVFCNCFYSLMFFTSRAFSHKYKTNTTFLTKNCTYYTKQA